MFAQQPPLAGCEETLPSLERHRLVGADGAADPGLCRVFVDRLNKPLRPEIRNYIGSPEAAGNQMIDLEVLMPSVGDALSFEHLPRLVEIDGASGLVEPGLQSKSTSCRTLARKPQHRA